MFSLNCKGRLITAIRPLVMGIVNITPDSFFEGSRVDNNQLLRMVEKMLNDGADFLSADEELLRLKSAILKLVDHFPEAIFSIDTFHSVVAKECIQGGFSIVNDISAGEMDKNMIAVVATLQAPFVCMHMRGTPLTMVHLSEYENVTLSVLDFFVKKIHDCQAAGIKDIIVDPGFGFSKNISQNFEILNNLSALQTLGKPILAGLSRKSTIYKTLNITAADALNGTTFMNTVALMNGASMLRVHDVKEAVECVRLFEAMKKT